VSVPTRGRAAELWVQPRVFGPLLLGLGAALSLALANRGLISADEGALLANAARILRGGVYYRDIDAYPFPAATYLLAAAMALFGERAEVGRALAAVFYLCVIGSLYACALELVERRRAALFGVSLLGFRFLAWPAFNSYTYSDPAFAAACLALALFLRGSRPGAGRGAFFGAGLAIGFAVLSKQNLGLYAGLAGAALLLAGPRAAPGGSRAAPPRRLARLALFAAGAALALLPALAYFASQGLLGAMLWSGLVRPFTGYLPTSAVSFFRALSWWELGSLREGAALPYFVNPYWVMLVRGALPGAPGAAGWWIAGEIFARASYTAIPAVLLAAALRLWRGHRRGAPRDWPFLSVALFAAAALLSAFPRADFFHVASVAPLVTLLAFALRAGHRLRLEGVAVAALLTVCGLGLARYAAGLEHRLGLDRARLWVEPEWAGVESVARYAAERVPEGQELFVYGHEAYYYFLTERFFAWPFVQLYPGQAGGDGGRTLAERLRRSPPALVIRGLLDWPGLPSLPSYTPELYGDLQLRYEPDPEVYARHPVAVRPPQDHLAVLRPSQAP